METPDQDLTKSLGVVAAAALQAANAIVSQRRQALQQAAAQSEHVAKQMEDLYDKQALAATEALKTMRAKAGTNPSDEQLIAIAHSAQAWKDISPEANAIAKQTSSELQERHPEWQLDVARSPQNASLQDENEQLRNVAPTTSFQPPAGPTHHQESRVATAADIAERQAALNKAWETAHIRNGLHPDAARAARIVRDMQSPRETPAPKATAMVPPPPPYPHQQQQQARSQANLRP